MVGGGVQKKVPSCRDNDYLIEEETWLKNDEISKWVMKRITREEKNLRKVKKAKGRRNAETTVQMLTLKCVNPIC